ncbi:hypothetical protein [Achromobacter sp.]|uniref:hypothetical protein n=1 Tax=Achromobacter sp. TaxID=134375 RepID=UPI0028A851CD|nr:hypothetical protein [Achromobacter sp.]
MNDRKLKLVFKGARNYVHGTTMFDETVRLLAEAGYNQLADIKFVIHEMTSVNLRLVVEEYHDIAAANSVAIMRFTAGGQAMQARIVSDDGAPAARVPYDEARIESCCQIDTTTRDIRLSRDISGFSQIEVLVSMNKALHLAVLEKPAQTSWVFCRWDGFAWPLPADLSGVTIRLKQTLGTRLTRADVALGQETLGQIYFSAKAAS